MGTALTGARLKIGAAVCVLLWGWSLPALARDPGQASQPSTVQPARPIVRDIVIDGATAFSRDEILDRLHISAGNELDRSADDLAKNLQEVYLNEDYSHAKVSGSFDEGAARLTLTVEEGRIEAVAFEGIDVELARRFEEDFEVRPGDVFNRRHIRRALSHLLEPTRGAFEPDADIGTTFTGSGQLRQRCQTPFELIDRGGKRVLVLHLRRRTGRFQVFFGTESREDWFSPVDGYTPALGFSAAVFDSRQFNHTFINGYVSYKFAREKTGYTIGFERPVFAAPKLYFGGDVHEMTASDDLWRLSILEQSLVALGFKNSFRDYYERRGYQLTAALRVHPQHEVLVSWRDERHETLVNETDYGFFRDDHLFRQNQPIQAGELHALVLGYGWDTRGFEGETLKETYLRHQMDDLNGARRSDDPGWHVLWTSELASVNRLGGDFDFRRHIVHARRYLKLSPHQYLNARFLGGFGRGQPPPQRQFALGGIGSVHGYRFKEAVGERMALFNVEYKTDLGSRQLKGIGFLDVGRVWRPVGESREEWLKGIGLGLEVSSLRVDFGWRLDDIPRSFQVLVRFNPPF